MKQIGIDVGGTFTDVVVLDEATGLVRCFKAATEYQQPADGIMTAFGATGVAGPDVSRVKLGTTLGLNALLTRRGAATGLITTAGFRDVLEIRRTHRDRLFDLNETLPAPLVPRHLRVEAVERVGANGEIVTPLDEGSVRDAWRALRAQGVTSVAITFLFSFKNPAHERRAREIIQEEGGAETIFISCEVLPVHREYERTSTTVVAAYVAPVVHDYVTDLNAKLTAKHVPPGSLSVMTNSGGSMAATAAAVAPVPTLLSGPAGGVSGAQWLARKAGVGDVLTLDMGGTSCDVSGIQNDVADERLDMNIAGLDIAFPTFDIHTVGAGGGSIAWIDNGGALRVGPASAGSAPGPACYGRGGTLPTVTDANLVLGRYDAEAALGGSLTLDVEAARTAIDEHVARPLGITIEQAASGIVRLANSNMVNAVRTISVERGRDPRRFSLVAFGGGGPVHATDVARELGMTTVLVPPFPGCTSAFGGTLSVSRRDALRSINVEVEECDPAAVSDAVTTLIDDVTRGLDDELGADGRPAIEVWMNLHYRGQAHDLAVRHPGSVVTAASLAEVSRQFSELHATQYGHSFADVPVELVTVRVTGFGERNDRDVSWEWEPTLASSGTARRSIYFEETNDFRDATVYDRVGIAVDERIVGPAVIHQSDATVLIPPGWIATNHPSGSLILEHTTEGAQR